MIATVKMHASGDFSSMHMNQRILAYGAHLSRSATILLCDPRDYKAKVILAQVDDVTCFNKDCCAMTFTIGSQPPVIFIDGATHATDLCHEFVHALFDLPYQMGVEEIVTHAALDPLRWKEKFSLISELLEDWPHIWNTIKNDFV